MSVDRQFANADTYEIGLRDSRMKDADLAKLCQNGDMEAFEQLFYKHQDQVYNVAYRMMNDQNEAEDMTQEIFLRAYQKIDKFNFRSAFSTWLYRLAVNMCIDELRKRKSTKNAVSIVDTYSEEALSKVDETTPEDHAISKDQEKQIWDAINLLRDKERAIIILKDVEGLSYKEISEVLKCSLGRVKSRLHEARRKLRAILETKTELLTEL